MVFAVLINFDLLAFGPTGYGDEMFWGLTRTLQISLLAYALGIGLGLCGAMGKLTGGKWLKNVLEGYTTLVRAVPDLVLILLLYYAGTDGINRMLISIGLGRLRSMASLPRFLYWGLFTAPFHGSFARRHPGSSRWPD